MVCARPSRSASVQLSSALIGLQYFFVKPDVTVAAIPASFLFLAAWLLVTGVGFALFGFETRKRSIAALDEGFTEAAVPVEVRVTSGVRR